MLRVMAGEMRRKVIGVIALVTLHTLHILHSLQMIRLEMVVMLPNVGRRRRREMLRLIGILVGDVRTLEWEGIFVGGR